MASSSSSDHWGFYQLPPFFTPQPAPAARERQLTLWAALLLDHASHCAQQEASSKGSASSLLRFYNVGSDVFHSAKASRRLPAEGARAVLEFLVAQHPNRAVVVSDDGGDYAIIIATNDGGLKDLEQSLLSWILEMGQGTTTAMLAKQGAVMTFDELAEGRCLEYKLTPLRYLPRSSQEPVPVASSVGTLSQEQAVRSFLQALSYRPVSVMKPFKITLFNLDGSDKQPYEGVKFGGQ